MTDDQLPATKHTRDTHNAHNQTSNNNTDAHYWCSPICATREARIARCMALDHGQVLSKLE